jgi:hypothetical protein
MRRAPIEDIAQLGRNPFLTHVTGRLAWLEGENNRNCDNLRLKIRSLSASGNHAQVASDELCVPPLLKLPPMRYQTRIPSGVVPQTWWGRLAATLLAVSLAVIGLFFLVFALIAAILIAALVIARIWWLSRKLRVQRDASVIEGAYSVEVEPTRTLPAENAESVARPPDSR